MKNMNEKKPEKEISRRDFIGKSIKSAVVVYAAPAIMSVSLVNPVFAGTGHDDGKGRGHDKHGNGAGNGHDEGISEVGGSSNGKSNNGNGKSK